MDNTATLRFKTTEKTQETGICDYLQNTIVTISQFVGLALTFYG